MKIAVYGKSFGVSFLDNIKALLRELNSRNAEIIIHRKFNDFMVENFKYKPQVNGIYESCSDIDESYDFLMSIGGDGTLLESITYIKDKNIPVIGINSGRLGFLADIAQDEIPECIFALFNQKYSLETRSLIEVNTKNNLFGELNFALNEVTIHKRDSSSMITIHAYLNEKLINSYWADGLIVATPTGSTAYSLSVGGPIVAPNSENFIITPLAPHNLTVRPIVVADSNVITLKVQGRSRNYLTAVDYRSEILNADTEIVLKKANFKIKLLKLKNHDFYSTIRNKLMWGVDKRN